MDETVLLVAAQRQGFGFLRSGHAIQVNLSEVDFRDVN